MNLQNPNRLDAIKLNGSSNFIASVNSGGVNNWGSRFTQGNALGFVPPPNRSESMDFAKFIQRDVQQRLMKQLDDGDDRQPSVAVGKAVLENSGSDCNSKREQKNSANVAECEASVIK
jgi:hypothetical protein